MGSWKKKEVWYIAEVKECEKKKKEKEKPAKKRK